jgi:hypothetical protein
MITYWKFLLAVLVILSSCNEDHNKTAITKNSIEGIWTDGSSENASFEIDADSIYYLEHNEKFRYELKGDSIHILYPEDPYSARLYFVGDTLFMNAASDNSKFWKFKNWI